MIGKQPINLQVMSLMSSNKELTESAYGFLAKFFELTGLYLQ